MNMQAGLSEADWKALEALSHEGRDILPDGADLDRMEALGLVERVGITWGITRSGRDRLAARESDSPSLRSTR